MVSSSSSILANGARVPSGRYFQGARKSWLCDKSFKASISPGADSAGFPPNPTILTPPELKLPSPKQTA